MCVRQTPDAAGAASAARISHLRATLGGSTCLRDARSQRFCRLRTETAGTWEKSKSLPHNKFTHVNAPAASGIPAAPYLGMTCPLLPVPEAPQKTSIPQIRLREQRSARHGTPAPHIASLPGSQSAASSALQSTANRIAIEMQTGSAEDGKSGRDQGTNRDRKARLKDRDRGGNRRPIPLQSGTHRQGSGYSRRLVSWRPTHRMTDRVDGEMW